MSIPRFLADEDLRISIVAATRRLEPAIDLLRIVDAGKSGASDPEVLDFASGELRLVVSHDVGTMKAVAEQRVASGVGITGLLLVPKAKPTKAVAESLLLIWAVSQTDEWRDLITFLPF